MGSRMDEDDDITLGALPGSPAHAILCELGELLNGLAVDHRETGQAVGRLEAERRGDPRDVEAKRSAIRRDGARASLFRVIRFLNSPALHARAPGILGYGIARQLRDLLTSLDDVAAGVRAPLFQPQGVGKRIASLTEEELRGKVAAVAELMIGDDASTTDAVCREIARQLDSIGYRRPYGHKGERGEDRIIGNTVRGWLKKAREGQDLPSGQVFRACLSIAARRETEGKSRVETARGMMARLAADLPGGRVFHTPTKHPTAGKK